MALILSTDISRLVHHHLLKEGYENTANSLIQECSHLRELKPVTKPFKLPRLHGPSLVDLLKAYYETKDHVIDELEKLDSVDFKEHDPLPALLRTLLDSLRQFTPAQEPCRSSKDTKDASSNTEVTAAKTCEASTNTLEEVSDAQEPGADSPYSFAEEDGDIVDREVIFSQVYGRLLGDRELHEKIAETINKKVQVLSPTKEPFHSHESTMFTQELNSVIQAVMAETQSDPAFEHILMDCIGIDESQDGLSVGTPEQSSPTDHQESIQNTSTPMVAMNPPRLAICPAPSTEVIPAGDPVTMNALSTFTLVTGTNGQITLVPSLPMPPVVGGLVVANKKSQPSQRKKKTPVKAPPAKKPDRSVPVSILPRPVITLTIPAPEEAAATPVVNEQVAAAVASAVSEAVAGFQSPAKAPSPAKLPEPQPGTSGESQKSAPATNPKPLMKIRRPKSLRRSPRHRLVPVRHSSQQLELPPPQRTTKPTPALEALVKLAMTECATIDPAPSPEVVESDPEPVVTTPSNEPAAFVTTPTSTRRRSHIRQLNFGESPDLPPVQPKVKKTNSAGKDVLPWDAFLRTAVVPPQPPPLPPRSPPPKDGQIFATPKGKAKRAKKISPTALAPIAQPTPVEPSTSQDPSASSQEPPVTKDAEETAGPASAVASQVAEQVAEQMTVTEEQQQPPEVTRPAVLNMPHFEGHGPSNGPSSSGADVVFQQPGLPVLATPRKEDPPGFPSMAAACDGQMSSSSFGTWDGEIPRTPQIQMDLTNTSSSPFLVSYTKGFGFLPAAESPSLPVPATPSISGIYSASNSIETPNCFYQFPSTLNTPRVDALRQERLDSPGKTLSTTMISPTQVVLGRSAPYFVPSGERAKGPIINQNATPEHVPELDKMERRRRSSTEMEPLQLEEESVDAHDVAAESVCPVQIMRQAADATAAALQQEQPQPTPCKPVSDQHLEEDLIDECRRLEQPSPNRRKQRRERYIELFGEDSNIPATTDPPAKTAAPAEPIRTEEPEPSTSSRQRSKTNRRSSKTAEEKEEDQEVIIKELMVMAGIMVAPSASDPPSKSGRSKKSSKKSKKDRNSSPAGDPSAKRKSSKEDVADVSKDLTLPETTPTSNETATEVADLDATRQGRSKRARRSSPSVSAHPVEPPATPPVTAAPKEVATPVDQNADRPANASPVKRSSGGKAAKKQSGKSKTAKPYDSLPQKTKTGKSPSKKTPVKLFKSGGLPPRGRKSVSFRQSALYRPSTTPKKTLPDPSAESSEQQEDVPQSVAPNDPPRLVDPVPMETAAATEETPRSTSAVQAQAEQSIVEPSDLSLREPEAQQPLDLTVAPCPSPNAPGSESAARVDPRDNANTSTSLPTSMDVDSRKDQGPVSHSESTGDVDDDVRADGPPQPPGDHELQDYLRLLPTYGTRVEVPPEKTSSAKDRPEQQARPTKVIVPADPKAINRRLVKQLGKKLRLTREECIFSQ